VTTSPHSQLTLTEPPGTIRAKRWYVLAEIVESERMYVNDLRILVHVSAPVIVVDAYRDFSVIHRIVQIYIHSLMTNLSLPLTSEQRKLVALNVDQLLQVHEPFAADLEKAVEDYGIAYGVNQKEMMCDLNDEPKFEWAAVNAVSQCFLNLVSPLVRNLGYSWMPMLY
jgi:RhoGEF domain